MTAPGKITLWGRKSSANVQKVLWTLAELSLPCEHIPAGGDHGGLSDPAYLAMNPNGRIPTLRDGDLVVWESDAIVRYLAACYGAGTLWPVDPAERAIADQWMTWGTTELEVDWLWLFWRLVRTPPSKRDPQAIARHLDATVARFQLLDRHLQGRDYLAGRTLTIADIPAGMTLYRWYAMDVQRPHTPNVDAWYARLKERPAYRAGVCIPFDELVGKESF